MKYKIICLAFNPFNLVLLLTSEVHFYKSVWTSVLLYFIFRETSSLILRLEILFGDFSVVGFEPDSCKISNPFVSVLQHFFKLENLVQKLSLILCTHYTFFNARDCMSTIFHYKLHNSLYRYKVQQSIKIKI
jgi:hypothetical protein